MPETFHTPGPWYQGKENRDADELRIYAPERDGDLWIASAQSCHNDDGPDAPRWTPACANARLISLAPQMYEALAEALRLASWDDEAARLRAAKLVALVESDPTEDDV